MPIDATDPRWVEARDLCDELLRLLAERAEALNG